MILDALTEVSSAQAIAPGATVSTNSIEVGSVAVRNRGLDFAVHLSGVSGTDPTLAVEVIGADNSALSSGVVSLGRFDPVIASGMASKIVSVKASSMVKKRYVGLRYTAGNSAAAGATPVALTVTASVAHEGNIPGGYEAQG